MVQHYSAMLHSTRFGWAVGGGIPWLLPCFATLHFVGMALLIGAAGVLSLRVLGIAKNLPIGPLQQLAMPWGITGFIINLVTGVGFYAGDPDPYIRNVAFWAKMLFILLAGINLGLFYFAGLASKIEVLGPGEDAPPAAKVLCATALFLLVGMMYWGRMLFFVGNPS